MEKILVLDSNSILHRAFYALPPLTTKKGENTGAIYGFLLALFKAIKEINPNLIFACFDFPAKTFRHKIFKEYKIQRPPTPKDLIPQIPKLKEILESFGIFIFEKEGFEADDLIGTICQKVKDSEKIVLSGDYDNLQLVDEKTKVWVLKTGVKEALFFDIKKVKEKYGIFPEQIADFKALIGAPSDNIPKISKVSEKVALELIKEFGSLKGLFNEIEKNSPKSQKINRKIKETLIQNKKQIFLNYQLAKIEKEAPINLNFQEKQRKKYDKEKVISLFQELEFNSLIKRLPEIEKIIQGEEIQGNLRLW